MNSDSQHPFYKKIHEILLEVERTQAESLLEAAKISADCISRNGLIHVFGAGHSHILAEEVFFRAGGLVQINAILDSGLMLHVSASGSMEMERLEGYATIVLKRYQLQPDDLIVIVSNSGRNPAGIDAAIYARSLGLKVICITSAEAYKNTPSRHSSGKKLSDFADVVLDTKVPHGDAILSVPGLPNPFGPASTIVGAALIQAYLYETTMELLRRGHQPNILVSANTEKEQDIQSLYQDYALRIRHF